MSKLDCRGLSCPEPVLNTRAQLQERPSELTVLVSSETARDNVLRLAGTMGYSGKVSQETGDYRIELKQQ